MNPGNKSFGRYEVVAELGRGAMGIVYKARDPQIDRFVAVKTVSLREQELEQEGDFRARFLNEAQAAGRLHHAGIVSIFDAGEDPETNNPYIVLEYVAGESLSRILTRKKKLPLATALQLAEEIARALDYAHEQGVIHRDIKPGNILITEEGHAKIADFGIARLNLAHFTMPGRVMGTPAFMAPEQLTGEGADGRSDLFSLGVILYAMVTGYSPFQGDSATMVCYKVANREPVAASTLELGLPREIDAVIARAMAKDPSQRYQRGAHFADELHQLRELLMTGMTTSSLQAVLAATARFSDTTSTRITLPAPQPNTRSRIASAGIWMVTVLAAATLALLVLIQFRPRLELGPPKAAGTVSGAVSVSSSNVKPATAGSNSARDAGSPQSGTPAAHSLSGAAVVGKASIPGIAVSHSAAGDKSPFATLDLMVQHPFKDATLFVWVDDELSLTRALHAGTQKRLVVFKETKGVESETLKIPAGQHSLRLRILSADHSMDLSKTVVGEFVAGDQRALRVILDRRSSLQLTWE